MTPEVLAWLLALAAPSDPATAPVPAPTLPSLPGLPVPPAGGPAWLSYAGFIVAALGLLGIGGVIVRIVDGWFTRRRQAVEADEVMTRVAVTLLDPLRERLESTERRLVNDAQVYEQQIDELRGKVREALTEADRAVAEAHRIRRLLQQWHRAIMDPTATMEWLRQLVGPDEPAI